MFQPPEAPGPWDDSRFTMRHLTGFVTQQPALFETDADGHRISTSGCAQTRERGSPALLARSLAACCVFRRRRRRRRLFLRPFLLFGF